MLRALGEQLRLLAADPRNHFASAIRQRAGPREAARYGQPLRRMILAMPRMIAQLRRWSCREGLPARVRRLQGFALAYLYDPVDFLAASQTGLFRYLDDAYLVARIYQYALRDRGAGGSRNSSGDRALARCIPAWVELAQRLLPAETARIDRLLDEVARARAARRRPARG